jgi:hypothetical protein
MRVFVLHCFDSALSTEKRRPEGFDRLALWNRLQTTRAPITVFLDQARRNTRTHFVESSNVHIVSFDGGSGSASFRAVLREWQRCAERERWEDDQVIVFLEDDYAVKDGWERLIEDGLQFGDYVTLYDHPDKYSSLYDNLPCKLFAGRLCHWRTTPSTTNSFATRWGTLKKDFHVHAHFASDASPAVQDHAKWCALWREGRTLVSSLPGSWSHEEAGMQSPFN